MAIEGFDYKAFANELANQAGGLIPADFQTFQKNYVIKILIDNLSNNKNIEETLTTISLMKDIPTFDKSGLLHSHLNDYQQENKDTISEELKTKIDELKKMAKA